MVVVSRLNSLVPGVRWNQAVRTVIDYELSVVLATRFEGEGRNCKVVRQVVCQNFDVLPKPASPCC